ncbi:hypothetical protein [Fodinibius halophilus]|uniref:VWA domain-containing protein n=1 Tax=Fodinibius halophilus TaxID=1736908 RepID=A0A6M1TE95_9BACT|nr:hypothetical protein [Fodinibius halophilus]NGP89084.1 hypothetical protein [Fodinibius halophilus]
MDFTFQGFQSALPLWSYVLMFIGTSVLAWWSYKDSTGIKSTYRYLLIGLRTAVFAVLFILLLNPFIKTETTYFETPTIMVMMDNSASTAIRKSSYKGVESYTQTLNNIEFGDFEEVNLSFYAIGSSAEPTKLDSLTFDAEQTNLSKAIQLLKANQREVNSAILISDGIYTQGRNPIFNTNDLEIPIYTVGLGDTTSQKDILVRSSSTNSTGYLDTPQPVTVNIASNGFRGQSFQVHLKDGNKILSTKTVSPDLVSDNHELTFKLTPQKEGLQQYSIVIPALEQEWTSNNNSQLFSVDVKDAKQSILSLAFEVHPDVKYVRSLLRSDKNTELTTRTWINNNRFIEGNLSIAADTVDLAIIHGYPGNGLPASLEKKIKLLTNEVPHIIFATPLFSPQQFEQEISSLPVRLLGPWNYVQVGLSPRGKTNSHPIMELPTLDYSQLPSLLSPVDNINPTATATQLFNSTHRGQQTNKPVLSVQEIGNHRISFFNAFGWFQFHQEPNRKVQNFANELLLNVVSWTATNPNNQLLKAKPTKTTFNGSEHVIIDAYLQNERGEMETNASIDLTFSSDTLESHFYSMENVGSGRYRLDLGTMPEGIYTFNAVAQKGDRHIDSQQGEFAVAQSNAEFVNTTRDDQLLRTLANKTEGTYLPYDSVSGFWQNFRDKNLLSKNQKSETSYFYLYRNIGWFILVIVLLSAEWITRKYLSLP